MAQIIILAGNIQEANVYARKIGLHTSRYINPASSRSIEGCVPSEVHILPGFRRRRDGHAMMAAVKRSSRRYQGVKFVEIDERGPLTERDLTVAHRYNALVDFGIPENVDPVIAMASVEVTPEDIVAEGTPGDEDWDGTVDIFEDPAKVAEANAQIAAKGIELKPTKPRKRTQPKPRAPKAPVPPPLPEIFE